MRYSSIIVVAVLVLLQDGTYGARIWPKQGTPRCDDNFTLNGLVCYSSMGRAASADEAIEQCAKRRATLVSILDQATNNFVAALKIEKQLIGLSFNGTAWKWDGGYPVDFKNWRKGAPSPPEYFGACATIAKDGKWENVQCNQFMANFVCEKHPVYELTTKAPKPTVSPVTCPNPNEFYYDAGQMYSPGYPNNYQGAYDCQYQLIVKSLNFVEITFEGVKMAAMDRIEVYSGLGKTELLAMIRGDLLGKNKTISTTNTDMMLVVFSSANTGSGTWKATWRTAPVTTTTTIPPPVCPDPSQFYFSNGALYSPGFPKNYQGAYNCQYQLIAKIGNNVEISFEGVKMAATDRITVYSGHGTTDRLAIIQGDQSGIMRNVSTTNSNRMLVVFSSANNGSGIWRATWNAVPVPTTTTTLATTTTTVATTTTHPNHCPTKYVFQNSGAISSPGYPGQYGPGLECTYIIIASCSSSNITIFFDDVTLSAQDQLYLYNANDDVPFDGFDGGNLAYITDHTSSSVIRMVFKSSPNGHGKWSFHWFSVSPTPAPTPVPTVTTTQPITTTLPPLDVCPPEQYSNEGIISSPGYPRGYGNNLACLYHLQALRTHLIEMNLTDVQTDPNFDLILIYDGPTETNHPDAVFSGDTHKIPKLFISTGDQITIRFVSTNYHSPQFRGWRAVFKSIQQGHRELDTKPRSGTPT